MIMIVHRVQRASPIAEEVRLEVDHKDQVALRFCSTHARLIDEPLFMVSLSPAEARALATALEHYADRAAAFIPEAVRRG